MVSSVAPLFVPGHMARMRAKAPTLGTTIIVDLEDSVPAADKEAARDGAVELVEAMPGACTVRINPLVLARGFGMAAGHDDLAIVVRPGLGGLVTPKVDSREALLAVDDAIRRAESAAGLDEASVALSITIETALGVANLAEIAHTGLDRPMRLSFGMGDFTTDLGIEWTREETECDVPRALVPIVSRAAGLRRPGDSVVTDVNDEDGLRASALRGKRLGYAGKSAIHPRQIAIIQQVYAPSAAELDWAHRVVETAAERMAEGQGAFLLDGRMIDDPIVARAREVLDTAPA